MSFNTDTFLPPVLAVGASQRSNGRNQLGSGLVTHKGIIDSNSFRATGLLYPQHGAGLEIIYRQDTSPKRGVLQSYDRDAGAYTDLFLGGLNITLNAQGGKVTLPAGTAQALLGNWYAPSAWSTPQANVWTESDVRVNITCAGTPLRIEFACTLSILTGQTAYVGLAWDGAATWPSMAILQNSNAYGLVLPCSGIMYHVTPPAGVHRVGIMLYTNPGGVSFNGGAYASLWVTEQRA